MSLFLVATVVLLLTPGPAVLYIIARARSIEHGLRAGLVSVLGIEVGNFVLVLIVTLGLSALLLSSALAFTTVRFLGAAYLIYLGLRTLLTRPADSPPGHQPKQRLRRIFAQGALVAVSLVSSWKVSTSIFRGRTFIPVEIANSRALA